DQITAGSGQDIIIGGRFGDTINAGDGDNLVIGDSGRILAATSNHPQLAGLPITLGMVETIEANDGGNDSITTGTGADIVFGGAGNDTIMADAGGSLAVGTAANPLDGANIVLGDFGRIDWVRQERDGAVPGADLDPSDID